MKRILFLISILAVSCIYGIASYGMGLFPEPPGHNIIIVGVVKCIENGVMKPEPGATVTVKTITDMAELGDYDLPEPETAVTDANGIWFMSFTIPLKIALPKKFEGEIIPKCKTTRIEISEPFETTYNMGGFYDFITGRAGNLTQLILDMAARAIKFDAPGVPTEIEFLAYASFVYTEVVCGKEVPPPQPATPEKEEEEPPVVPTTPEIPEKEPPVTTPPTIPGGRSIGETPHTPPWPEVPKEPPPQTDKYRACITKCLPILERLKPLEARLKELESSESDEVKRIKKEIERLTNVRDINRLAGKQQKYITPDGGEHWGSPKFEQQYRDNGYNPVAGTERMSPERQKFIDMVNKKIDSLKPELSAAMKKDRDWKDAERKEIEGEINRVRQEYEDCIKACDKYKEKPKDTSRAGIIKDFVIPLGGRPGPDHIGTPSLEPQVPQDTTPLPGGTKSAPADAVPESGEGGMIIGEPVHLPPSPEDDFDKVPPLDLSNYDTTVVPIGTEEVQYKKLGGDRVTLDTGTAYKMRSDGMDVDVAALPTGKGADFRKWTVDEVKLDVDGKTIEPSREEDFYVARESVAKEAAVATFVALGSQYRRCAEGAESGEVCPVTGQRKEASERKDTSQDAIDKAGMAAGLGLLSSQAKGEIKGKKASFNLNKDQAQKVLDKKAQMKAVVSNKATHQSQTLKTTLR